MLEERSTDIDPDTEEAETDGHEYAIESSQTTASMVTQLSSTETDPEVDREDVKDEPEHPQAGLQADKQQRDSGDGGVIDIDKLLHTIDITRKVAMLQHRLIKASQLAQQQATPVAPESTNRLAALTPPTGATEAASASSASNLRKRKSMASLSIVAPREVEDSSSTTHGNGHAYPLSPSRPSTYPQSPGAMPRSPSYTALRSPSTSAAAGIQVLTNIASRRRESGAGLESPRNGHGGSAQQPASTGPRVAFAYPRSPGGSSALTSVQTLRSPVRGRYISSSGYPRFETSGFSEFGIGVRETNGVESVVDAMDVDEDPDAHITRKRQRGLVSAQHQHPSQPRKPSVTLMPPFGTNTIYGIQHRPGEGPASAAHQAFTIDRSSKKPRSASHSVESRPFIARNTLRGYQHVETPRTATGTSTETPSATASASTTGARINIPLGTDASDVDAANGLMSMLGSAPAAFNPSRNAGPAGGTMASPAVFEGSAAPVGTQIRAPKPRAASFAAILPSNGDLARPGHRLASPTRMRRLQHERQRGLVASPSSARRQGPKPSTVSASDENASGFATSSSSDEEKFNKASASASDEDHQAAEAILFLAASPSPAITHSSPAKKTMAGVAGTAEVKIGRVLFDDAADDVDSARPTHSLRNHSGQPNFNLSQKRQAVGESPLQQPPINNTSPSRDRYVRTLPAPLPLPHRKTIQADTPTDKIENNGIALPLTASTASIMDETDHPVHLPEPTQLLSPPDSDHFKP